MEVHKHLGPGLLESVYEKALMREFDIQGLKASNQVPVDVVYKGLSMEEGLRLDILVDDQLIIELKSVEEVKPVYHKQILTYLKLTGKKVGLLINFNVEDIMKGIKRFKN